MYIPPALLFIGPDQRCAEKAHEVILRAVCPVKGCRDCTDCRALLNKQHYLQLWLSPDSSYTVSHLEAVFNRTSFALQPHEHYFIVLERADACTHAAANSLLKLLEEPPAGYHFILLAPRTEGIVPTVVSRCVIESLTSTEDEIKHPLYHFFTACTVDKAGDFAKELERHKTLERDIPLVLDQLSSFWHERMLTSLRAGDEAEAQKAVSLEMLVQQARLVLPLSGSAKLFFKDLYLSILKTLTKHEIHS